LRSSHCQLKLRTTIDRNTGTRNTARSIGRVETFLKNGPLNKGEQQGCFSVNSMREFAILPDGAYGVVTENRALLQRLLAMNIEAEEPKMAPSAIAEMVLSFFSGLCIERNLKSGKPRRLARSNTL
jgi:hypothetical protein